MDGGPSAEAGSQVSLLPFSFAVDTAVRLGAVTVSNSYEVADTGDGPSFDHPGVLVTASAGDQGFGTALAPAVYPGVLAVGGTTLTPSSSSRGWAESAWQHGGSACSTLVPKPSWQSNLGCSMRTVADVSAVANPSTGLAVFCTDSSGGGWQVNGGTSAASPMVAGALTILHVNANPQYVWGHPENFFRHHRWIEWIYVLPRLSLQRGPWI
jgi:hypothetical protein